jgi:hypothetical protein
MNISEKYKTIWIAPERTGTRKIAEIFVYYDFKSDGLPVFNHINGYSHNHRYHIDDKYKDYDIIVGLRNPYGKTYSIFKSLFNVRRSEEKGLFKKFLLEELPKGEKMYEVQNPILDKEPNYIIRMDIIFFITYLFSGFFSNSS